MLAGVGELAMVNIFISVILSMAFLYWARDVLIPLALAVLLTFLLIPVVKRLQRLGLWRVPSVILVVILAGSLLGGIGWVVMLQLRNLANDLPQYESNIKQKIADLRQLGKGGLMERVQQSIHEIVAELQGELQQASPPQQDDKTIPAGDAADAQVSSVPIMGCPARDEVDELALRMFRQLLDPTPYVLEVVSAEVLFAAVIPPYEQQRVERVCIAALPPGATARTRFLCKRLRARFLTCKIVVGHWGFTGDRDKNRTLILAAGADEVGMALQESSDQVMHLGRLLSVNRLQPLPDGTHS